MKFNTIVTLILLGAAVFAMPLISASGEKGAAQDPDDDIQIGVVYKCDHDRQFKILSCDENDKCQVYNGKPGLGSVASNYKDPLKATIEYYHCKPADASKPKAKPKPTPQEQEEPEPEEKPAPNKKPESKPKPKPTPEAEPEPEEKEEENEPDNKDDPASAEPAPAAPGPQFSIGDCVQVDGGKGVITRADGDSFYVDVSGTSKRVPFASASKLKKATGCGD